MKDRAQAAASGHRTFDKPFHSRYKPFFLAAAEGQDKGAGITSAGGHLRVLAHSWEAIGVQ
jgi:hypothetical protein